MTYRLCMNPAMRIVIISETASLGEKFLFSIKTMLTDPAYLELQLAYAPTVDSAPRPAVAGGGPIRSIWLLAQMTPWMPLPPTRPCRLSASEARSMGLVPT